MSSTNTQPKAVAIRQKTTDWPWPQLADMRKEQSADWLEVTHEDYWYALEVLPPIYLQGLSAFGVGEAANHDRNGHAVRSVFAQIGERYFAREITRLMWPRAQRELLAAVHHA